jgi:hypothetical protein
VLVFALESLIEQLIGQYDPKAILGPLLMRENASTPETFAEWKHTGLPTGTICYRTAIAQARVPFSLVKEPLIVWMGLTLPFARSA